MSLARNILSERVEHHVDPGDVVQTPVDLVMVHDYFVEPCIEAFEQMGFDDVWDPSRVLFVGDHEIPSASMEESEALKTMTQFAEEQGIEMVVGDGVSHRLMPEMDMISPGDVVVGTDSHTCTSGAFGAFASGFGYTDVAAILGEGKTWVRAPESITTILSGELPDHVYGKDIILKVIGDIGTDGAVYKSLEFTGNALKDISTDGRLTLCNMAVEAGAQTGLVHPASGDFEINRQRSPCDESIKYDVSDTEPMVATPHSVDHVVPVDEIEGREIDQAFIGSCTSGYEDLAVAADILSGSDVPEEVRLIVTPPTRDIYTRAVREGIIGTLQRAGAVVTHPSCGLCAGSKSGGIVADGERVITTTNRNYRGRLGGPDSEAYLASAATAARSARAGVITSPRP